MASHDGDPPERRWSIHEIRRCLSGRAQDPSAKVGVTRIKVILFRLHHGCVETHVSISVQKTNIPIAAPNISSAVTATTTRPTNELGCFCMMVRLQAMIRMPTNKNGELFPKDLP